LDKSRILYCTPYLLILSGATLGFWFFEFERIGIPLFLTAFLIVLVLKKDSTPSIPILFCGLFMISQTEWSDDLIPLYLYFTPVVIFLGMMIHVVRFRPRLFQGKMAFGIVFLCVAMILSTFNAAEVSTMYVLYAVVGLVYSLLYFFYANTIEGDQTKYLLQLMVILGTLISVEVLIYYLRSDDILLAIATKTIDLGWGISNFVATYLIIFIPASFYYAKTQKNPFPWLLLIAFESSMLVMTLSRGGILAFAVIFVLLLVYLFKSIAWKATLFQVGGILLGFALLAAFNREVSIAIWERLSGLGLDDSGRIEIYLDAIAKFREHPLFGNGILARYEEIGEFRMYHNTILHTLATFGLAGLASVIVQVVMMFKIILTKLTPER